MTIELLSIINKVTTDQITIKVNIVCDDPEFDIIKEYRFSKNDDLSLQNIKTIVSEDAYKIKDLKEASIDLVPHINQVIEI